MKQISIHGLFRRANISAFAAAREAASAIEFALIAPVFATMVVTLPDMASVAVGIGTMQTGIRSSVQYVMNGGTAMDTAQAQGLQAWDHRPADAVLSAVKSCTCAGVAAACDLPCPNLTAPVTYVTVTASGTYGGHVFSRTETFSEKVRIR